MPEERYITIVSARKTIALRVSTILYVLMNGKYANIHVLGDQVYRTTMTLGEIEEKIGDGFLRVHRGCLVAVMAIHNVTDTINLSNGESLGYTARKKGEIMDHANAPEHPDGHDPGISESWGSDDGR